MNTKFPYQIRWAYGQEWEDAMAMVWKTFVRFDGRDFSEEGIQKFYHFICDKKLYDAFLKGAYQMMLVLDHYKIIGVATIRYCNYVSLLFVDGDYHHKGIGRELMCTLCNYLKDEMGERYVSLKSAPGAVGFYRKLGFRVVRSEEEYEGVKVISMEKFF